jgi:hypothetical protein
MLSRLAVSGNVWGGFHILYVQNVLDEFELKLIQILLRPEKKTYSRMAISRNDNYVQRMFTADIFRKRWKRENSTVGPGFMS